MPASESKIVQKIVADVLSPAMFEALWTNNYNKVLPISVQDFDLSTMLPAMFYLFRYGERRGSGRFLKAFAPDTKTTGRKRKEVTIDRIGEVFLQSDDFVGFSGDVEKAILGDLLLSSCLENTKYKTGRDQQIQRVFPVHYLSSWIDLPKNSGNLRNVPEMMVSILASSKEDFVESCKSEYENSEIDNPFAVGHDHERNVMIRAFNQGIERKEDSKLDDRRSDRFDESEISVGLEQLLMIRLAQRVEEAPSPLRSRPGVAPSESDRRIPNQHPIVERTSRKFSEDIRLFLAVYSNSLPRHCLIGMLESCMAIGLTSILTATVNTSLQWEEKGRVPALENQTPLDIFVDCSSGVDGEIRDRAEMSMDHLIRKVEFFPATLMALRILDFQASSNRRIKDLNLSTRPYSTRWLDLLGDLLHDRHDQSSRIRILVEEKLENLSAALGEFYPEGEYEQIKNALEDEKRESNPILRLARGLMGLMGPSFSFSSLSKMTNSCFYINRTNGIAISRKTTRGKTKRRDARSMILSDSALDYLAHLHVLNKADPSGTQEISLKDFMEKIRKRYGFHIDRSPQGMNISNFVLQRNRSILERRLRDLGLLTGVNDAESMKRLRPRFEITPSAIERVAETR